MLDGAYLRFNEYYAIDAGYRVMDGDDIVGFITFDQFLLLRRTGAVTRSCAAFDHEIYDVDAQRIYHVIDRPINPIEKHLRRLLK